MTSTAQLTWWNVVHPEGRPRAVVAAGSAEEAQAAAWREWTGQEPRTELETLTRKACWAEDTGESVADTASAPGVKGHKVTALELLDLLESTPEGPRLDKEMDRLSGIATPGDVDPTLARQFVFGRLLMEAAGVDFSERGTSSALGRVIDEPQGRCRSHVGGSPAGARMIGGEKEHVKDAQGLERCHELAIEASRIVDAVREDLPEASIDFDDGDTSLPAQLARIGGLVDDIVDASRR